MFDWLAFCFLKKSKLLILIINIKGKREEVHEQFEELKDKGKKCVDAWKKGAFYNVALAA